MTDSSGMNKWKCFLLGLRESDGDVTTNLDHLDGSVSDWYEYGRRVGAVLRGRRLS